MRWLFHFTEIERFFNKEIEDTTRCSDALLLDALRRIVFGRVKANLIRLHRGGDPVFGKILDNLDVALTRDRLLRFAQNCLFLLCLLS